MCSYVHNLAYTNMSHIEHVTHTNESLIDHVTYQHVHVTYTSMSYSTLITCHALREIMWYKHSRSKQLVQEYYM